MVGVVAPETAVAETVAMRPVEPAAAALLHPAPAPPPVALTPETIVRLRRAGRRTEPPAPPDPPSKLPPHDPLPPETPVSVNVPAIVEDALDMKMIPAPDPAAPKPIPQHPVAPPPAAPPMTIDESDTVPPEPPPAPADPDPLEQNPAPVPPADALPPPPPGSDPEQFGNVDPFAPLVFAEPPFPTIVIVPPVWKRDPVRNATRTPPVVPFHAGAVQVPPEIFTLWYSETLIT